jgi:hypothetical protein
MQHDSTTLAIVKMNGRVETRVSGRVSGLPGFSHRAVHRTGYESPSILLAYR